jgi:hypothetical protein
VIIDEQLTWREHIENVKKKILRFSGIFHKLKQIIPLQCLKTVYYSMIYPHILYGVELYANTNKCNINALCVANNRIMRILLKANLYTPINELYAQFNTLTIPVLFKYQILKLVHRFFHLNNTLPDVYSNYFSRNSLIHDHDTRRSNDLHVQRFNQNSGQRSIKYLGVKFWNDLPANFKLINSHTIFDKKIKDYLISV